MSKFEQSVVVVVSIVGLASLFSQSLWSAYGDWVIVAFVVVIAWVLLRNVQGAPHRHHHTCLCAECPS